MLQSFPPHLFVLREETEGIHTTQGVPAALWGKGENDKEDLLMRPGGKA